MLVWRIDLLDLNWLSIQEGHLQKIPLCVMSLKLGGIKRQLGGFGGASAGSYIIAAKITISSMMVLVLRE
jgi:hypothetical protein